jgi:SPP1 gp7 family putative phage head morphogenesis protein
MTGITRRRALVLARTEIIAAHAEGQLDAFEAMNIEKVGVMAEWSTAGDDLVCAKCEPLEGAIMTVKEARGLLPRHPNCRCAWIPAIDKNRSVYKRKFKSSLKAELPKRTIGGEAVPQTVKVAKRRSTWPGKELL